MSTPHKFKKRRSSLDPTKMAERTVTFSLDGGELLQVDLTYDEYVEFLSMIEDVFKQVPAGKARIDRRPHYIFDDQEAAVTWAHQRAFEIGPDDLVEITALWYMAGSPDPDGCIARYAMRKPVMSTARRRYLIERYRELGYTDTWINQNVLRTQRRDALPEEGLNTTHEKRRRNQVRRAMAAYVQEAKNAGIPVQDAIESFTSQFEATHVAPIQEAVALFWETRNVYKVAQHLGINHSSARQYLINSGVPEEVIEESTRKTGNAARREWTFVQHLLESEDAGSPDRVRGDG